MKIIPFKESNDTDIYKQPVYDNGKGLQISCWSMSWFERCKIILTGKLWLSTFQHHTALPQAGSPFKASSFKHFWS